MNALEIEGGIVFENFHQKIENLNRRITGKAMAGADILNSTTRTEQQAAICRHETAGERVAFIYEAHRLKIYRFLMAQGLDAGTAQELSQEVFVKLFVAFSKGVKIESEQGWLYGVAAKLAVNHWRREGRAMWIELDSLPALVDSLGSADLTPEAVAIRRERLRRVAKAMTRLPKEQRLGIHLRMQGLRYRAIAEALGVSVSTAAEWLSLAVERLRRAANE